MLVNDRTDRLSRTLSELQLSTPTHMPTTETALAPSSASHPQQIARPHLNSKDPTFSIFGGFAKVTQAARDLSSNPFSGPFNSRLLLNLFGCPFTYPATFFDQSKQPSQKSIFQNMSDERKRLLADYENFRKGRRQSKSVVDQSQETATPVGVFEVLSVSCFCFFRVFFLNLWTYFLFLFMSRVRKPHQLKNPPARCPCLRSAGMPTLTKRVVSTMWTG